MNFVLHASLIAYLQALYKSFVIRALNYLFIVEIALSKERPSFKWELIRTCSWLAFQRIIISLVIDNTEIEHLINRNKYLGIKMDSCQNKNILHCFRELINSSITKNVSKNYF